MALMAEIVKPSLYVCLINSNSYCLNWSFFLGFLTDRPGYIIPEIIYTFIYLFIYLDD